MSPGVVNCEHFLLFVLRTDANKCLFQGIASNLDKVNDEYVVTLVTYCNIRFI